MQILKELLLIAVPPEENSIEVVQDIEILTVFINS